MNVTKKEKFHWKSVSLKVKLPLFISLLIVIVLLGTSVSLYFSGSAVLTKEAKEEMASNGDRIGEGLWSAVQLQEQSIYLASAHDTYNELLNYRNSGKSDAQFFSAANPYLQQAIDTLKTSLQGTSGIESFSLIDGRGTIVASSNDGSLQLDLSDREYFQQAMEGNRVISDALISRGTNNLVVTFAQPVKDPNDRVMGVFIATVSTDFFTDKLKNVKINEEGYVTILSRSGITLYHSMDPSQEGKPVEGEGIAEFLAERASGNIIQGDIDSEDTYIRFTKIPNADWVVVVSDTYEDINRPLESMLTGVVAITIIALVVAIAAGILLSRYMTKPLVRLNGLFGRLASGDLTVKAEGNYGGEFKDLADSFNRMAEQNKALISNMNRSIRVLNTSTYELDQTAKQTSTSAMETAKTSTEIANAMESQAKDTEKIVDKFSGFGVRFGFLSEQANAIKERAEQIVDVFHSGNKVMEELAEAKDRNEQEVLKISEITKNLQESSHSIGSITEAIADIAGQTNLLALNASIEASRAGEHGRGFAVVATEIRKLAEQSSRQSNEIHDIIQQNISFVARNHNIVNEIRELSSLQDRYVEEAREAFRAIFQNVGEITEQIKGMAEEVASMSGDKDDVLGSVQSLSATGEEVSASVEEVTATMEEQSAMVQQLASMVETIDSLTKELAEAAGKFKTE